MSIIETVKEAVLGKKADEPGMGNALWRETVIKPLKAARDYQKSLGEQKVSSEQYNRRKRTAAKRAVEKASRKRNRK